MLFSMNDENSDVGRLIVDRQSPALRKSLWRLVRQAKGGDVLAPVTVVGPTRYANLSLRHELGRVGFVNVRFIVLPMLSELLGGAALAGAGRKPLTAVMESVSLRAALSQATGPLAPVRDHPSTHASVKASFRELHKAGSDVLAALAGQGGVRGEVVRLYQAFRENIANDWYDVEDLTQAAAEAVRRGQALGLDDLGLIVFYLPRNVSPADAGLMEALAGQHRCAALLGTTGDREADGPADDLSKRLQPFLGEARTADGGVPDLSPLSGESVLHIAPNAHEELRWVIRQIVQEAGEKKTPFHRMAILYRAESPYGSLVRDELRLAGIPLAGPGRESLADTAVGRALIGLLRLSEGELRRADVMAWLTACPISPPAGRTPGFNPSRWDSLTRKAGIVGGLDQWRNRIETYARQLTGDATRREKAEEITEARASRMRAEATAARNALYFVEQLAQDVRPPVEGSKWGEFCQWAEGLLEVYLSRDIPETEGAALEQISRTLEGLRAADSISQSATLIAFRQTIEEALRRPMGHLGVTGQGVFVSPYSSAAGMSFDAVWLVGMIEGQAPPPVRPDPLLPEAGWQAAGGKSRLEERVASERYDYLSVLASAPRRALSYPVADASSQREAYPSRWFLEQATALEGERVHTSDLPRLRSRSWLTANDSGEQALADIADTSLADRHDYHLHRLLQWRRADRRLGDHPLAQRGTLADAARMGRRRGLRRLTEFDGNLSEVAATAGFGRQLQQSPVSATSLESWAACPFRYFLGHVLRLSALETPEETTTIGPLDRGSLVHDILERFIKETGAAVELPAPGEAWGIPNRDRLDQIAGEEFSKAESSGVTGKRLLWELAKQEIRDDLETFLEEDATLRAIHGTTQIQVEAAFGFGADTPVVEDPETQVSFRGRIDRVDLNSDGSSALVIDYKTGSSSPYQGLEKDPIDHGKRLQLGVYSLAAREFAPGATEVQAAYWFTRTGTRLRFAPPSRFDINDSEVRERFREGVSAIVAGIHDGLFPANPGPWVSFGQTNSGPKNCGFCDFDSLCPARRIDIWERKKSDDLLSDYAALADEGGEE
jgi:RecB family exonuclease